MLSNYVMMWTLTLVGYATEATIEDNAFIPTPIHVSSHETYNDCMANGFAESITRFMAIGEDEVNRIKFDTSFECNETMEQGS